MYVAVSHRTSAADAAVRSAAAIVEVNAAAAYCATGRGGDGIARRDGSAAASGIAARSIQETIASIMVETISVTVIRRMMPSCVVSIIV